MGKNAYIAITIEAGNKRIDLSMDKRGSVADAYAVLEKRGMVGGASPAWYKSMLLGEWINAKIPLSEQGVVSGDMLSAQLKTQA